jgi:hypothetical protein
MRAATKATITTYWNRVATSAPAHANTNSPAMATAAIT